MAHSGHVVEECHALDIAEGIAVSFRHLAPRLDCGVHLTEVQYAVGRAHLVHLGVDAGCHYGSLVGEAEVLEVVYALLGLLVLHHHRAPLDGVVYLCCVER